MDMDKEEKIMFVAFLAAIIASSHSGMAAAQAVYTAREILVEARNQVNAEQA